MLDAAGRDRLSSSAWSATGAGTGVGGFVGCRAAVQGGDGGVGRRAGTRRRGRGRGVGQSVHSWLVRYREAGLAGLADRSSRLRSSPSQASPELEARGVSCATTWSSRGRGARRVRVTCAGGGRRQCSCGRSTASTGRGLSTSPRAICARRADRDWRRRSLALLRARLGGRARDRLCHLSGLHRGCSAASHSRRLIIVAKKGTASKRSGILFSSSSRSRNVFISVVIGLVVSTCSSPIPRNPPSYS